MQAEAYIGWDIGGAHLKMAHIDAAGKVIAAHQFATPLWQGLHVLNTSMAAAKRLMPAAELAHAVTTTAELADIFQDRRSGLSQLAARVSTELDPRCMRFYAGRAGWVLAQNTGEFFEEIASANWHATATYAAQSISDGILVDIGSTTTDIIPFTSGKLINRGYTDYERLNCHELVYTGTVRTPLMAIADQIMFNGKPRPVVAECFATMADVYRLTGELAEEDDMLPAADGAGKLKIDSARRLARMVALDAVDGNDIDLWTTLAHAFAEVQIHKMKTSLLKVQSCLPSTKKITLVGAGTGRFLVRKFALSEGHDYVDFADLFDTDNVTRSHAARSATAVSVAQLARLAP